MSIRSEILDQFAETIWALAWSDWQEELDSEDSRAVNLSGCEITEIMSEVPESAMDCARQLLAKLEALNGGSTAFLDTFEATVTRDNSSVETLAHYLVMESCGHGVCYADDYPEHGLKVLYCIGFATHDGQDVEAYM